VRGEKTNLNNNKKQKKTERCQKKDPCYLLSLLIPRLRFGSAIVAESPALGDDGDEATRSCIIKQQRERKSRVMKNVYQVHTIKPTTQKHSQVFIFIIIYIQNKFLSRNHIVNLLLVLNCYQIIEVAVACE
jgi:hypothetical protein